MLNTSTQDSSAVSGDAGTSLWHLIPLRDYHPPLEPASETVRSTLQTLWERLNVRSSEEDAIEAEPDAKALDAIPQGLLEWIAPVPTWEGSCLAALDQALAPWLEAEAQDAGLQLLVAAPYSGMTDMVMHWCQAHEYAIIKPPTPKQIFENSAEWMSQWEQNEAERLVLPWLERCYLRHHAGLDLVRRLLDWLWETKRPCLLVTDSWAWRYLKCVYPLEAFPGYPLTLAALDARALHTWFYRLAQHDGRDVFIFRQQNNGKRVIYPEPHVGQDAEDTPVSGYLRHLAARSRGIASVARAIWRDSLRIRTAADLEKKIQEEEPAAEQGATIWVTAWEELELPVVATALNGDHAFILHTLLLHNGLPEELLAQLLPISSTRVLRALRYLQTHKLVTIGKHGWQVTPIAYPAIRSHLRNEGYLVDEL
ncbi:MAG: hypothetical protein KDE19_18930 [Caldilineaceae bacterium]|nr:hypothetical protein [Caldilineaceae bacterium]